MNLVLSRFIKCYAANNLVLNKYNDIHNKEYSLKNQCTMHPFILLQNME
jgi:hypothetical protein